MWKLHLIELLKYDDWVTVSSDSQQLLNHTNFFHCIKEMEKSRWYFPLGIQGFDNLVSSNVLRNLTAPNLCIIYWKAIRKVISKVLALVYVIAFNFMKCLQGQNLTYLRQLFSSFSVTREINLQQMEVKKRIWANVKGGIFLPESFHI